MTRDVWQTGNPAKIRQLNRKAVLSCLREEERTSRARLVKTLNLAPATVSAVVGELIDEGWLIETGLLPIDKRSPGRPSKQITLNSSAAYVVGIVLRIEHDVLFLDSSWSDYSGALSIGETVVVDNNEDISLIVQNISTLLNQLIQSSLMNQKIISLCIGIPGVVDDSEVMFCPNIKCLQGVVFHQKLANEIEIPIHYDNDVNLIVVSELTAQPRLRFHNFACLFISQGVGAGVALNGELWKSTGWAGEIGQLDVPFAENEMCKLEWIIGMDGYIAECEGKLGKSVESMFFDLNHNSSTIDSTAEHMIDRYINYLYMAIQLLNAAFDLDEVILGESDERVVAACLPRLQQKINESQLNVTLSSGVCAHQSSVKGAAMQALHRTLDVIA